MDTMERPSRITIPPASFRPVRTEQRAPRAFFAFPCAFLLDVPLDMTGIIQGAFRAARASGYEPTVDGEVLVTDALRRGAVLVEIRDDALPLDDASIVRFEGGDVLVRELPAKPVRLRAEIDELVRWSREIDADVSAVYVRYDPTQAGFARPIDVFAVVRARAMDASNADA